MTGVAHRHPVRVYYEDTDFSGVVYHANYLRFFERGRTELLRALGIGQAALHAGPDPLAFAVARMEIQFRKPARMDDELTVETVVEGVGGASLALRQRLLRRTDLLVEASVRIAVVAGGRAARLPPSIASRLASAVRDLSAGEGEDAPLPRR